MTLRIGTRPSALAMAQGGTITERLRSAGHPAELVTVTASGDRSAASAAVTYSSPAWKPP
ncbi:MAG: Porphobilinogen deaminase, dipyromethane cofactor binding domain, partial [Pseudonocardiales bacterium]|nr:Porphobilinogen deaminase, dipyromethane cofactor binding domain [Pseudonocardiales bacterium]